MLGKIKEKIKNAFKRMNENVVENDEGAELLEIAIGIALVAVIVAVVLLVIDKVSNKAKEAESAIEDITWSTK